MQKTPMPCLIRPWYKAGEAMGRWILHESGQPHVVFAAETRRVSRPVPRAHVPGRSESFVVLAVPAIPPSSAEHPLPMLFSSTGNRRLTIGIVGTCLGLSLISFGLRIHARLVSAAKLYYCMMFVVVLCCAMSTSDFAPSLCDSVWLKVLEPLFPKTLQRSGPASRLC